MSPRDRILLHLANLLAAGTGLVLAWMVFLAEPVEAWSVVAHPWQPAVQHLHVLAVPLLVFAVGLVWRGHVTGRPGGEGHRHRSSGVLLAGLFAGMAATGYLLQVAMDKDLRELWSGLHTVLSLAWVLAFAAHVILALRRRWRTGD